MRLARFLLVVHSLITIVYGMTVLFDPDSMADYMGLAVVTGDGRAELVTMYVGMSCTMSLFMLYGAFNRKWFNFAFLYLTLSMTGITVARTLTFLFFDTGSYIAGGLYYDIPVIILIWLAFYRMGWPANIDSSSLK